jgi:hypothetical protein
MKQQVDNRPNGKPSKKKKKATKESEREARGKMTAAASKEMAKLKMPVESLLGRTSKKSLRKPGVFTKGA